MISKEELEKWAFQLNMDGDCDATDKDIETLITQALDTMEELETAKRCLPVDKEFEVRGSWIGSVQNYIVHLEESLEVMGSEPVAYIFKHPAGRLFWSLTDESNKGHDDVMPVYASPQPALVVPDEVLKSLDLLLHRSYFRRWIKNPQGYVAGSIPVRDLVNVVLFADACRAAMLNGGKS